MYDFSDKVVLITGGTGALGKTLTQRFISSGATTIATYLKDENIEANKGQNTNNAQFIKADVTREEQVVRLISAVVERFGHIDILVNSVGGYLGGKSVTDLEEHEWDLMMNLNLKSAFLISKHVIPVMKSSGPGGKIVHISSKTGLKAEGHDSAYAASKSGLIRLVESISQETKDLGINVNCILPNVIDTEANRRAMPKADFSKWVKTDDITNVVFFLCSQEAKVITGAAIPTYGLS
ncbi:MAG: SDR family NAD(P)-dependent oxidoreductase [Nitrososphaeraceae archaeon]